MHDKCTLLLLCRADILGTNCNKLLKLKINGWVCVCVCGRGGGGGVRCFSFSCNRVWGARARHLLLVKKIIKKSLGVHFTADKNDNHHLTSGNGPAAKTPLHIANFSSIQLSAKGYL